MNSVKIIFLFVLFFVGTSDIYAQITILQGIVVDNQNNSIPGATVFITNSKGNITKYSIVDKDGGFRIDINSESGIILNASCLGYKKVEIDLDKSGYLDINKEIKIILSDNIISLNEIIVKPENIEQDTTNLNLKLLNLKENDKLNEILNKSPNFNLDSDGSIIYRGKSINKILVNGKETFNQQNSIALEKIENRMIDRIQVVSNYQDNFSSEKESLDETVLNIVSKSDFKDIFTGSAEVGYGLKNKGEFNGSLMKFSDSYNTFLTNNTNNIGESVFKSREIISLFGNNNEMSEIFAKSLNELFDERNRSKNFISNSNFTLRKQTDKFRFSTMIYYIDNDKSNDVSSMNSYLNGDPISSYSQYTNNKFHVLLSNISFDYRIKSNQIVNVLIDYDFVKQVDRSQVDFNNYEYNMLIDSVKINRTDNNLKTNTYNFSIVYSNDLSKNFRLSAGIAFNGEDINIHNVLLSDHENESIRQINEYNKSVFDPFLSFKYKVIKGLNSDFRVNFNVKNENIGNMQNRNVNNTGMSIRFYGNKIAKKITYDINVGVGFNKVIYNGNLSKNYHIPFKIRFDYENRLSRFYFSSFQDKRINSLSYSIDQLLTNNSLIIANEDIPTSFFSTFKSAIGYSYNSFLLGKSFNMSISYTKMKDHIKECFQTVDVKGIYKYAPIIAHESKEYKLLINASKNFFGYSSYPIKSYLGGNISILKTPLYYSNNLKLSDNYLYYLNYSLQSISKKSINLEIGFDYSHMVSKVYEVSLKENRLGANAKIIYKKNDINAELGYLITHDKIFDNSYLRQSLNLKFDYIFNPFVVSLEGVNVENILGIFDNSSYNTKYSVQNGISQATIMNDAVSYLILKFKFNY